ncbi:MAG: hypothetical protein R3F23_08595 [Verrucomicrobiia bacterium]
MEKQKKSSFPFRLRFIAAWLAFFHLLTSVPVWSQITTSSTQAGSNNALEPELTPQEITVNRTVPSTATTTTPDFLRFSPEPTDQEIYRAKVLLEPLVTVGGRSQPEENKALAETIKQFTNRRHFEDTSSFTAFLEKYPTSVWRAAILGNLGDFYYRTGYFSKALTAWEEAWQLAKTATDRKAKLMADWIVGQLAEMNSRVGRFERLAPLLKEIENRSIEGSASEWITRAKAGLWEMQNRPTRTFVCGTMALKKCAELQGLPLEIGDRIMEEECSLKGFYLKQLYEIAQKNGLRYQLAKRDPGAPIPDSLLPLVIHWKVRHYGALTHQQNGRFLMSDPIFSPIDQWMSTKAIDEESTGYCLVPAGERLPKGWHSVTEEEIADIWGKGKDTTLDPDETKCTDSKELAPAEGEEGIGMAVATVHSLVNSLHINDIPVAYKPPVGSEIRFKIMYNQREVQNPANFTFSNFGSKWTFNWSRYVIDDGPNPEINEDDPPTIKASLKVTCYGGADRYHYDAQNKTLLRETENRSELNKISDNPIRYERNLADGSVEIYDRSDASQVPGRKIFITQTIDPQGNKTQIHYDNDNRIVAIQDSIGQVSTLSYESKDDPYRITKITDPYGRNSTLNYSSQGALSKITDVKGLPSNFEYGSGNFIKTLTTPYGKKQFSYGEQGADRWIEMLDAYGDRERVEYRSYKKNPEDNASFTLAVGGAGNTWFENAYNIERNTFVWDKRAMKMGVLKIIPKLRSFTGLTWTVTIISFQEFEKAPNIPLMGEWVIATKIS